MLKVIFYLVYIFWRNFFYKGNYSSLGLLWGIISVFLYWVFQNYDKNFYILFLFLPIFLFYHLNREDISLLKVNKKWKFIVFSEYIINNLPILLVFCLKGDFLYAIGYILMLFVFIFLQKRSKIIQYPFNLYNPFWHIVFRKYKLIFFLPIVLCIIVISKIYDNENLVVISLFFIGIVLTSPYFEREFNWHLKISNLKGKSFLIKQIIISFFNSFIILGVPFLVSVVFFGVKIFWILPVLWFILIISIFTKYTFFESVMSQTIVFSLVLGVFSYGFPIIGLPFLYYYALKNIKNKQNVTD